MSDSDSIPPEGFRVIPGYPRYAIDQNGTVLSVCVRGSKTIVLPWSKARCAAVRIGHHGYKMIILRGNTTKTRNVNIHTLVLEVFVGSRPNGMECRHIDGNRLNNHVSNLAWGTSSENHQDKILHGTSGVGEGNPSAKLTSSDVLNIRQRHANGESCQSIANDFNVSDATVRQIAKRIIWKHI